MTPKRAERLCAATQSDCNWNATGGRSGAGKVEADLAPGLNPSNRLFHALPKMRRTAFVVADGRNALALARLASPAPMHCMRRPLAASPAAAPAMHCHHGAAQAHGTPESQASASPASQETSFRSLDCCCGQHCDCCRNSKMPEWARPAKNRLSFVGLHIQPASHAAIAPQASEFLAGPDSARAPPRS